jgi:hypothetical protein
VVPYWLLFSYFAIGVLLGRRTDRHRSAPVLLIVGALAVWLTIGLRYEVGADWKSYQFIFSYAGHADLDRVLLIGDPGYQLVNWCVQRIGGDIWLVNLIAALIFTWGLYRFARSQPDPWLCFVVAIPYLVVVVAMGYTRQAIAIGIIMAGLASLIRGDPIIRFALYVGVAALFHKTAVAVLPLVIFSARRNRTINAIAGIAGLILLWDIFLAESVEGFVDNYIRRAYSSQGAAIRVVMNFVAAGIMFLFRRRMDFDDHERRLWRYFGIVALAMPILLVVVPSSTAIDRVSLYLIPLQIAVIPRLANLFKSAATGRFLVLAYSAAILFTWLNYATHSSYWVPYRFYPW